MPPSGGPKDETPPKLVSISPADSQTNMRVTTLRLTFDEFVTLNNPTQQIQLSPLIAVPLTVTTKKKSVIVKIPDSLLKANTTYQLSFGNAIQDIHESNPFTGFNYLFSTGSFFDSLTLEGKVFDAATGLSDTSAFVILYNAKAGDSAILRQKPLYVTHVDGSGYFKFKGLPGRDFLIYALRDQNNNLMYDGGSEGIAFHPGSVRPLPDTTLLLSLNLFVPEGTDTATAPKPQSGGRRAAAPVAGAAKAQAYQVLVDTANTRNRTFDVNKELVIQLASKSEKVQPERIFLSYDSAGISVESPVTVTKDTFNRIRIQTNWKEDALYELRLQKGFATDSAGTDLLPGIYSFRTKRKEDYGAIRLHLPGKYLDSTYLLQIYGPSEKELFYSQPVTDTLLQWQRLATGPYNIRIVYDENKNGKWDSGTLFPMKQPETVIPYPSNPVRLREGWDNEIDFEKR